MAPSDLHTPIRQNAVMLEQAKDNPTVSALFDSLKSAPTLAIIHDYGYQTD